MTVQTDQLMKTSQPILRYSEAFKTQVLQEIESGGLTMSQARIKYKINGTHTIQRWAKKYGNFGLIPKLIRVEKPNERDQLKALKAENKRLKEALADMLLDQRIAESTLEVICEQHGWDVEVIKKKAGMQSLKKVPQKGKK